MGETRVENTTLRVPARMYKRPNGSWEEGNIDIPGALTEHRASQLKTILDEELFFTMEYMPIGNMVNICLDDGDFDYRFELVSNTDAKVFESVLSIIDNFDVEAYRKASHDHNIMYEEGI